MDQPEILRKLTGADVKKQTRLLPKRTKLDEFVYKRPNLNDTDTDFETPQKKPVASKKPTQTKKTYRKTKQRDKRQPKIKSSLLRQDQLFTEIVAQHSLAEQFNPDEIQLALALSKSETLEDKQAEAEPPDIRKQLEKFGFRTAAKEYYNTDLLEVFKVTEGKSKRKKYRWSSKITALTLRNEQVQAEKLARHINNIKSQNSSSISEFFAPKPLQVYSFISGELCALNLPEFSRVIQDESHDLELSQYFVKNLFPVSHVPAGHLLRKWSKIQGRDNSLDADLVSEKPPVEVVTCSAPASLYATENDWMKNCYQPIRANSPDIFDCSLLSDAEQDIVDLTFTEEHQNLSTMGEKENAVILLNEQQRFADSEKEENAIILSDESVNEQLRKIRGKAQTEADEKNSENENVSILLDESENEHDKNSQSTDFETRKARQEADDKNLENENVSILLDESENEHDKTTPSTDFEIWKAQKELEKEFSQNENTSILLDERGNENHENIAPVLDIENFANNFEIWKAQKEAEEEIKQNENVSILLDESENEHDKNSPSTDFEIWKAQKEAEEEISQNENASILLDESENEHDKNSPSTDFEADEKNLENENVSILLDESDNERNGKITPSAKRENNASEMEKIDVAQDNAIMLSDESEKKHGHKSELAENAIILLDESEDEHGNSSQSLDIEMMASEIKTKSVDEENLTNMLSEEKAGQEEISQNDNATILLVESEDEHEYISRAANNESFTNDLLSKKQDHNMDSSDDTDLDSPINKRARRASRLEYEWQSNISSVELPIKIVDTDEEEIDKEDSEAAGLIDLTQNLDENDVETTSSSYEPIILSDDEVNYSIMRVQQLHKNDNNNSIIDCLANTQRVETKVPKKQDAIFDDSLTKALAIAAALAPCSPPASSVEEKLEEPSSAMENSHEVHVKGITYLVCESNSPPPTYESLSEAHLQAELKKFGIKALKRHQAVKVLDYIYRMTHPIVLNTNLESLKPKTTKLPKMDLKDCFGSRWLPHEQTHYSSLLEAEEYIFQTNITKKTAHPLLPFHLAFSNLVAANQHLHERILMYDPIDVESIYHFFKNMGIRYDPKQIREFIDRRSIVFRYETPSGSEQKPRVAQKSRKRKL